MKHLTSILSIILLFNWTICTAQNVPIVNFSLNNISQAQLEIEGKASEYYLLHTIHPNDGYESVTSLTLGVDGPMTISEPLSAFPEDSYYITAHSVENPDDTDGDGIDDLTEWADMPTQAPLNFAPSVPFVDGTVSVNNHDVFTELAVVTESVSWAPFLNNQEFVKFAIVNQGTDNPEVYFINSKTHFIHAYFLNTIDIDQYGGDDVVTGEIVYNPNEIMPNGVIGSYSFNYSFGDATSFEITRRTFELLAANMPYLENNLQHFIAADSEINYESFYEADYEGSRIRVVLESQYFADVPYIPFNLSEGFGFFRLMGPDDNPGSRDIVLYESLPNTLPRVGGIITSVVQTPLSHVNLRAIQDNLPNAYIQNPLEIDSVANLLNNFIYYKVEQDSYTIREATQEEVNEWYDNIRPTEDQIPIRDLSQTEILPLDEITFDMSTSFGAKCSNVATMRTFGFPEGTIPNGFGIPFYFYDEFMKYNGFYEQAEEMLNDPEFLSDLETRIDMLKDFRDDIKDADMPQWMLDELQEMHDSFPEGTSIRCRSSTNNEDLPGFSGAGLYTSKTQHPEEGHIKKSVKQVYASMWNFRAYDERDFYRIDHFVAAMGILCHPNFKEEKSNGVGVSIDPLYGTEGNFYLNTQVGEFLITNPDANSIAEEILLSQDPEEGFTVLRTSNLTPIGELVMDVNYLNQMREYLQVIHDEFAILYDVVGAEGFGMDIEYKVTAQDQLIIKQARPWVSFWANINATYDLGVLEINEPISSSSLGEAETVSATIENSGLEDMGDFELSLMINNEVVETMQISEPISAFRTASYEFTTPQDFSEVGLYDVAVITSHPMDGYDKNDTLQVEVRKLNALEASFEAYELDGSCGSQITIGARVTNLGEFNLFDAEIETVVNGQSLGIQSYNVNLAYLESQVIPITISTNLQASNNEIVVTLININDTAEISPEDNSSTFFTDLSTTHNNIRLVVNGDNWPQETSWTIAEQESNFVVAEGFLTTTQTDYDEEICVNYEKCYTITVRDSYGDGMCCGFGQGNFQIYDAAGQILVNNDGNFGFATSEDFCPQSIIISTEDELGNDISISPNPTEGIFYIEAQLGINTSSEYRVEIYDNLGRQIQTQNFRAGSSSVHQEISIEDQQAGYYFVKCFFGEQETVFKVVKL